MKIQGTVVRSDLEGGLWLFKTNQGMQYQLEVPGGGSDLLEDGVRATLEGEVDGAAFGIGMAGPVFKVERYKVERK